MPNNNWPPSTDMGLQTYSVDFLAKIVATPATYGLLAADGTAMTPYVTAFTTQLGLAMDPATQTKVVTMAKQVARVQLVAVIRALARRVQANNTVTAAAKVALGLPVHSVVPTPINPPSTRPMLNVVGSTTAQLMIRIVDETTPTRRKRPTGTVGAQVYTFVAAAGTTPPADLKQWMFEGMATKADFQISYAAGDIGKQAHVVARWANAKGESGPNSLTTVAPIAA